MAGIAPRPAPAVPPAPAGFSPAVAVASPSRPPVVAETPAAVSAAPVRASAAAVPRNHIVQPRETLGAIARRYGVKLEALIAANPGLNPRRLRPGQKLILPP